MGKIIAPEGGQKITSVKGINPSKQKKFDRNRTRQQDMPVCAGPCGRQVFAAAVQGYDGKWRCLTCNDLHAAEVLHESGDSAPNASEHSPGRAADAIDPRHAAERSKHAARMLERYGVTKRRRDWA